MPSLVPACAARLPCVWLLTLGATLLICGPADAQLRVDVPLDCGSQGQFMSALEQLLGRPLEHVPEVNVRITAQEAGYQLVVERSEGARVLRDPSCAALFSAAVLMVAVDAGFVQAAPAPSPVPPAPAELEPSATVAPETPPTRLSTAPPAPRERARRATAAPGLFLTASAGAALGPVPSVAGRLELGVGARFGRVGVTASGHFITPREAAERANEQVRIHGFGLALVVGVRAASWLELALGPEFSLLRGRVAPGARGQDVALAFAPRAELWLVALRGRVELSLGGLASYFARRPRFVTPESQTLFRSPAVAIGFGLRGRFQFL